MVEGSEGRKEEKGRENRAERDLGIRIEGTREV